LKANENRSDGIDDNRLVCPACAAMNPSLWSCEHATADGATSKYQNLALTRKDTDANDRPCGDPRGVERSAHAWSEVPGPAEPERYARAVGWSRWVDPGQELRGGTRTRPILYQSAELVFLEQRGLKSDDSDRKGEGPKGKRAQLPDGGRDIPDYVDEVVDLRAAARVKHPRWRARLRELDTDAGYVFLRRWALGITFHKPGGTPPPARPVPDDTGWPQFSRTCLSPEGLVKRNLENALNAIDTRRWEKFERAENTPAARHNETGTYRGILADVVSEDSGWAVHQVTHSGACPAKHKADRIHAQKLARERAENEALSLAETGHSRSDYAELQAARLEFDAAKAVTTLPRPLGLVLLGTMYAEKTQANPLVLRLGPCEFGPARTGIPTFWPDQSSDLKDLETAFVDIATAHGVATDVLRAALVVYFPRLRRALRAYAVGRSGGWTAHPGRLPMAAMRDVTDTVMAVWESTYTSDGPKPKTERRGRPAKHDEGAVIQALTVAHWLAGALLTNESDAYGSITGVLRDPLPMPEIAAALCRAAESQGYPDTLSPETAEAIVRAVGIGSRSSLSRIVSNAAAALLGLPVEALSALVKKAR
jgi:hypothetical protein